jgi:hypothetical protein
VQCLGLGVGDLIEQFRALLAEAVEFVVVALAQSVQLLQRGRRSRRR